MATAMNLTTDQFNTLSTLMANRQAMISLITAANSDSAVALVINGVTITGPAKTAARNALLAYYNAQKLSVEGQITNQLSINITS